MYFTVASYLQSFKTFALTTFSQENQRHLEVGCEKGKSCMNRLMMHKVKQSHSHQHTSTVSGARRYDTCFERESHE